MRTNVLGPWLAFTLYMGAARADANPQQLKEIRQNVIPALQDLKRRDLTTEETRRVLAVALTRVQTIMGPSWEPTGEWMIAIRSMLGDKDVRTDVRSGDSVDRRRIRMEAAQRRARTRKQGQPFPSDGR